MTFDHEDCVLSTGRRFYVFCGRLHPEKDGHLTYGHDGPVSMYDEQGDDLPPFTKAERAEIADFMIARWLAWKATGNPGMR